MKQTLIWMSTILAAIDARPTYVHAPLKDTRDVHVPAFKARWNAQLGKREVPQEKSHQQFLTTTQTFLQMNNPDGIVDPVFGLLGNAAAAAGQGTIPDTGLGKPLSNIGPVLIYVG